MLCSGDKLSLYFVIVCRMIKLHYVAYHPRRPEPSTLMLYKPKIAHGLRLFWIVKEQWHTQEFCLGGGSSINSVDRGQTEWGSGGIRPLVRGSAQFANE
jgi:hypothetical protein